MTYLIVKALLSGLIVAIVSEVARRAPGIGALLVSLPTISLLTFLWLWRDTGDSEQVAALAQASFWYFLPSMPLFLVLPALLRGGHALLDRARPLLCADGRAVPADGVERAAAGAEALTRNLPFSTAFPSWRPCLDGPA